MEYKLGADELATEVEMDVRHVSVVWNLQTDRATVDFSGCSVFEAVGLLRAGILRLESDLADDLRFIDDPEDEEEDDDDDE